jgi:hypothetical protein
MPVQGRQVIHGDSSNLQRGQRHHGHGAGLFHLYTVAACGSRRSCACADDRGNSLLPGEHRTVGSGPLLRVGVLAFPALA